MDTLSLSGRASILQPSPTLGFNAKVNAMRAEGIDIVSLVAGEPDFPTPQPICDEAIAAIQSGFTKYTPTSGIPALKQAIVGKLERENSLTYAMNQIVVSCGAKQSIYNALMVLIDPGDEVLLFAPFWMTYAEQVTLAGGVPVHVRTHTVNGFLPDLDDVKAKIGPKTRAIVLNSPSNPTGAVYPLELLRGLADLALKHDLWIVTDEIYERLTYEAPAVSIASLGKDVYDRTVTVGGCSKTYAMTGWRIGFAAAPAKVASAMSNLQDQVTSNPTSFAQRGAVVAFNMPPETVEQMRAEFQVRRDLLVGLLQEIDGVKIGMPGGAFYAFPDVSAFLGGKFQTDGDLADHLLETAQLAMMPGYVFYGPGHLRVSYAASRDNIRKGVERLAGALGKLVR